MIFPGTRLSTPAGLLLPSSLTSNEYVRDLFFPPLAEIQHPFGSPEVFVRPAAPFPYANRLGVAILVLTPVAVAAFLMARSWTTRIVLLTGALAMVPPAMATSNRGMFAALGLAVVYIVVRLAVRNRAVPVLGLGAVGLAAVLFLLSRGLVDQIAARQEYGKSTGSRFSLYTETIQRTLEHPLLGYGAPRPSGFQDLSVGTQGYVWTVMFSHGFVGLALFLLFLWGTTLRTWRAPSDVQFGAAQRPRGHELGRPLIMASTSCRCCPWCWLPRYCSGGCTGWMRMTGLDGMRLGHAAGVNLAAGAVGAVANLRDRSARGAPSRRPRSGLLLSRRGSLHDRRQHDRLWSGHGPGPFRLGRTRPGPAGGNRGPAAIGRSTRPGGRWAAGGGDSRRRPCH